MSYVKQIDIRTFPYSGFGSLNKQFGGFDGKNFIAHLGAGAKDAPRGGVEERRILGMIIKGQFGDGSEASIDRC
ncbi:hypothetical protein J2S92_001455 [Arthrobacter bambusae]|nr:hypothetical protein [Arthrobacter bambusae]MDQ0235456.1 hypothetical protein [Arthrobacter bambusae]